MQGYCKNARREKGETTIEGLSCRKEGKSRGHTHGAFETEATKWFELSGEGQQKSEAYAERAMNGVNPATRFKRGRMRGVSRDDKNTDGREGNREASMGW
eukprot:2176814-Pleurochrysis_carterae.AAC.1